MSETVRVEHVPRDGDLLRARRREGAPGSIPTVYQEKTLTCKPRPLRTVGQ